MKTQLNIQREYTVTVRPAAGEVDAYQVAYFQRGLHQARTTAAAKRAPEIAALARVERGAISITWEKAPMNSGAAEADFDEDARSRIKLLHEWTKTLTALISSIRAWSEELDWSTRVVDKRMEDSEIGDYVVPALIMQQDTVRVGLEPVGRAAPGAEGIVDLYVLPAYDDLARLFFYDDRWNLYYPMSNLSAAAAKPLSKKVFRQVLNELIKDAR